MLHQSFHNCQTFLPAAGQLVSSCLFIFKTRAAKSLGKAGAALGSGGAAAIESVFDHRTHRGSGIESRVLLDTGEAGSFAKRYFPAVGSNLSHENSEQGGFAGSVRANQADTVSFRNGERNILEERVRS